MQLASIDRGRSFLREYNPPKITALNEYYEISGSSAQDLRDQMAKRGFRMEDGARFASVTRWSITWDYDKQWDGERCSAGRFTTNVKIVTSGPKWSYGEETPLELVERWDAFLKGLAVHEQGHRDIAVDAAGALARAAMKLPREISCVDFERQFQSIVSCVLHDLVAEETAYDAATDHGASQSAVF